MLKNIAREDQDASDKELRSFLLIQTHCNLDLGCRAPKISPFTLEKQPKISPFTLEQVMLRNTSPHQGFLNWKSFDSKSLNCRLKCCCLLACLNTTMFEYQCFNAGNNSVYRRASRASQLTPPPPSSRNRKTKTKSKTISKTKSKTTSSKYLSEKK